MSTRYARHLADIVLVAIGVGLVPCSPSALVAQTTARPEARAQTVPVRQGGDAADFGLGPRPEAQGVTQSL
jgi:hypothetical protein